MRKIFKSVIILVLISMCASFSYAQSVEQKAAAHFNKGVTYEKAGNINSAIDEFSEAHKLMPKDVNTLCNLGVLYMKNGNYANAYIFKDIEKYNIKNVVNNFLQLLNHK